VGEGGEGFENEPAACVEAESPAAAAHLEEAHVGKAAPTVRALPAAVPQLNTAEVKRDDESKHEDGGVIRRKKLSEPKVVQIASNNNNAEEVTPRKEKVIPKKREVFNSASKRVPSIGGKALQPLVPLSPAKGKTLSLPVIGGKKQGEKEWRKKHDDFLSWVRENKKAALKQPEDEPMDVVVANKENGLVCSDFC